MTFLDNPHTNFAKQKNGNALASLGAIRPLRCEFIICKLAIQLLVSPNMAKLMRGYLASIYI